MSLPPIGHIQQALRNVTERLPLQLDPQAPTPQWSELEWQLAPAVAGMHGVCALLAAAPGADRPEPWRRFLESQRVMTLARHERLMELLDRIAERARCADLPFVALKGAALYNVGLYVAGERPMADLDLLVRPCDLEAASRMLGSLGYRDGGSTWRHRSFDPVSCEPRTLLGEHADNPLKVELHERIAERLPGRPLEFSDLMLSPEMLPGINPYPSTASLLLHVLAHTAGSMVLRGLRLVQLLDISRLSRRMSSADWREFMSYDGGTQRLWWAAAPLIVTGRYLPLLVPSAVMERLRAMCPALLRTVAARRTLTALSYSTAAVALLPGIVWSRSLAEALRYVTSRVTEGPALWRLAQRTQPWASEQRRQPQRRPLLQRLTSRPTRPGTMVLVRAALECGRWGEPGESRRAPLG